MYNTRYSTYINITYNDNDGGTWFQIYPHISPFEKSPFNEQMFTRYKWGEVVIKNEPNLSGDAYELFDLILATDITQEIRIKVVLEDDFVDPDSTQEIVGYFGQNDCSFDFDKKILRVTPSILDQYTNVLENWETEVDVIGNTEITKAKWSLDADIGVFAFESTHNLPLLVLSSNIPETKDVGNYLSTGTVGAITYNTQKQYDLTFQIVINATLVFTSFPERATFVLQTFDSSDTQIDLIVLEDIISSGTVNLIKTFNQTVSLEKGGYVMLRCLAHPDNTVTYNSIIVSLDAQSAPYTTEDSTITVKSEYLEEIEVWNVNAFGRAHELLDADTPVLTEYFEVDDSPKDTLFNNNSRGPTSDREFIDNTWTDNGKTNVPIHGLYFIGDTTSIEEALDSSGFEPSEVTVYKGTTYYKSLFNLKKYRRLHASAKFARFRSWENNDGSTPVGTGWTDTGQLNENGKRLWVKKPFDGGTSWTRTDIDTTGGEWATLDWIEKISSKRDYPNDEESSLVLQSRDLRDVLQTIYNGTHSSLATKNVISVFLWNDDDGVITVADGTNYAANEDTTQKLNNIKCIHTFQFKSNVDEDSEDAVLKITLKSILEEIDTLFGGQIFWFVDSDGNLHIEHLKYIDLVRSVLDLTTGTAYTKNANLLTEKQAWSYDKSKMYSLIEIKQINAGYVDFTNNTIRFDKIVSNKRNEDIRLELQTNVITTDIKYCVENPSELENGLVLVTVDDNNEIIYANAPVSNTVVSNGDLALSTILKTYRYEGTFTSGTINNEELIFPVTTRTKTGNEFTIKGIYDYDFFKDVLGVGFIESLKHDMDKETTTITLKYRFKSGADSDIFILMISKEGDYDGAENIQYNFG